MTAPDEVYDVACRAWIKASGYLVQPSSPPLPLTEEFKATVDAAYEAGIDAGREAAAVTIDKFSAELRRLGLGLKDLPNYINGIADAADIIRRGEGTPT